jgi:hypothetical protein
MTSTRPVSEVGQEKITLPQKKVYGFTSHFHIFKYKVVKSEDILQ